jgi:hypothetical protein
MSIDGKSPEDLVRLAEASGSIVLDCNGYTIEDLIEITRALKTARTLTILNAGGKNTTDLLRLAAEAPGQVIFSWACSLSSAPGSLDSRFATMSAASWMHRRPWSSNATA